jgi:hypothetical protein
MGPRDTWRACLELVTLAVLILVLGYLSMLAETAGLLEMFQ